MACAMWRHWRTVAGSVFVDSIVICNSYSALLDATPRTTRLTIRRRQAQGHVSLVCGAIFCRIRIRWASASAEHNCGLQ